MNKIQCRIVLLQTPHTKRISSRQLPQMSGRSHASLAKAHDVAKVPWMHFLIIIKILRLSVNGKAECIFGCEPEHKALPISYC